MYYTFEQALLKINGKLKDMGIQPLASSDAKEYGIVDDMTDTGIDDIVREVRDEEHSVHCENLQLLQRGDLDHLSDYDS